jgi:glutamate-1-semialdehyde aminotransferase
MRLEVIDRGIDTFPLATKQWSISRAHTAEDIEATLQCIEAALTVRGCSAGTIPQHV